MRSWDGGRRPNFVSTPVRLVNLSTSGCLIELPRTPKPAKGQPAWICPLGLSPAQWIEGTVRLGPEALLEELPRGDRLPRARVTFESFKTLIYGSGHLCRLTPRTDGPEHERDHFWK